MQAAHPTATAFDLLWTGIFPSSQNSTPQLPHPLGLVVSDLAITTSACSIDTCLEESLTFQNLFHVQLPGAVLSQNGLQSLQAFQPQLDDQPRGKQLLQPSNADAAAAVASLT